MKCQVCLLVEVFTAKFAFKIPFLNSWFLLYVLDSNAGIRMVWARLDLRSTCSPTGSRVRILNNLMVIKEKRTLLAIFTCMTNVEVSEGFVGVDTVRKESNIVWRVSVGVFLGGKMRSGMFRLSQETPCMAAVAGGADDTVDLGLGVDGGEGNGLGIGGFVFQRKGSYFRLQIIKFIIFSFDFSSVPSDSFVKFFISGVSVFNVVFQIFVLQF